SAASFPQGNEKQQGKESHPPPKISDPQEQPPADEKTPADEKAQTDEKNQTDDPLEDARQWKDTAKVTDELLRDGVAKLSQALIGLLSSSVVVLIYVFFLLLGAGDVNVTSAAWREIDAQIRSYLVLKTMISLITGIVFGLALWLFGVRMAITFGLLAFLLNYIPNIGPLIASLLPIPFIVLHPGATVPWMAGAIVVTSGIQVVSGNVVEPKMMGKSFDLHPVVVLLALMFFGMVWGIVGMFLATPIIAGVKIVLERIEATKPLANLMAGRITWE
ncbi:MAG: AI-2E family transporter, partial [Planctomycetales bacterium]